MAVALSGVWGSALTFDYDKSARYAPPGILLSYLNPTTGCCWYGVSSSATCSGVSVISTAPNNSSSCSSRDVPIIGAATPGLLSSQASATWARVAPVSSAMPARRSAIWLSFSSVSLYSVLPTSSETRRAVVSPHGRVRRPRASGLHGITATPSWWHSGSISRSSSR